MARLVKVALCACLLMVTGCFAPLRSPGIPACSLSDRYRYPEKSLQKELNYAQLTRELPSAYLLGPDDVVRVIISDLSPRPNQPQQGGQQNSGPPTYSNDIQVTSQGEIMLPVIGSVKIKGLTLEQASKAITNVYSNGVILQPKVSVTLQQRSMTSVMVLGEVESPGVYQIPKYEDDIAHALALAGGLTEEAGDAIEVQRRSVIQKKPDSLTQISKSGSTDIEMISGHSKIQTKLVKTIPEKLRIPLRGQTELALPPEQAELRNGDVIRVPTQKDEVFFVTGKLSPNNAVRFSLGRENRDLGSGFILPHDRDIDVVTAVAMAGYIDPIDSPTTVTVHRTLESGQPMLINVDLIAARTCRLENIMVQPGDIIYLNPDASWWFRRTFDRVLPDLITLPFERSILRAFGQSRI